MGYCETYCSHGGVCELEAGHEGLHDSRYCQWSDTEALSKGAADLIVSGKPGGMAYLALERIVLGDGDDD